MKNTFLGALFALALVACEPAIEEKNIGEAYDLTTGLEGSWEIHRVQVTDLTLPLPEQRDISDYYLDQPGRLGLEFNVADNSYTVENAGLPSNPFGNGGTFNYTVDANGFPTGLVLLKGGQDSLSLGLINMVRSIDPFMGLDLTKGACDDNYASYQYTFKRK